MMKSPRVIIPLASDGTVQLYPADQHLRWSDSQYIELTDHNSLNIQMSTNSLTTQIYSIRSTCTCVFIIILIAFLECCVVCTAIVNISVMISGTLFY